MKKWIFAAALAFTLHTSFADTPPAREINSETYDAAGSPIGSTSGALNVFDTRSASTPLSTQIIWSGSPIDPRNVNATQSGSWFATSKIQDSLGNALESTSGALDVYLENPGPSTVTVNQGAPTGIGSAWPFELTDGNHVAAVDSTNALKVNGSYFTQPVSQVGGWTTAATQSGTWTVQQGGSPWAVSQSGSWTSGRTWTLNSGTDSVTVSGSVSTANASIGANGVTGPTSSTQIGVQDSSGHLQVLQVDGSKQLLVNNSGQTQPVSGNLGRTWTLGSAGDSVTSVESGTWNINNISGTISLPTGASTAANQATMITDLGTINSTLNSPMQNSGGSVTVLQPSGSSLHIDVDTSALPTGAATNSALTTINSTLGSPFQVGGSIGNTSFAATQATAANLNATVITTGGATIAKDSSLATINTTLGTPLQNSGGSVSSIQSGTWSTRTQDGSGNPITSQASSSQRALDVGIDVAGVQVDPRTRSWDLSSSTDNVASVQSGTWTTGRTWDLGSGTDSIAAVESGTWNLNNISGTVSLPTGASTAVNQATIITDLGEINSTLGSPFQAGGSIGNTSFAATQATAASLNATVVTTGGAEVATNSELITINSTLGSPLQAGGSIGNTSFAATQTTAANLNATVVTAGGATIAKDSSLSTINTTLGSPMQNSGGSVTVNAGTGTFSENVAEFGGSSVVTGTGTGGSGIPRVTVSEDSNILATQSGSWTTGRTWALASGGDSISAVQSGTWTVGQGGAPWSNNITQVGGGSLTLGQKTMSASIPTSFAANQTPFVGRITFANIRNNAASTNITTSAFVTLFSSTASQVNRIDYSDSTGQDMQLCYAATCGALAGGATCKYLPAYGSGDSDWNVPSGQCVGIEALSATASAGITIVNLMN